MHCNITQATTVKDWVRVLWHTTPLTHINFFWIVCVVGVAWCGHLSNPLPYPLSCWLCHHYQRSLFFSWWLLYFIKAWILFSANGIGLKAILLFGVSLASYFIQLIPFFVSIEATSLLLSICIVPWVLFFLPFLIFSYLFPLIFLVVDNCT